MFIYGLDLGSGLPNCLVCHLKWDVQGLGCLWNFDSSWVFCAQGQVLAQGWGSLQHSRSARGTEIHGNWVYTPVLAPPS